MFVSRNYDWNVQHCGRPHTKNVETAPCVATATPYGVRAPYPLEDYIQMKISRLCDR